MPISKQEFYEGAALHALARTGRISGISYEHPFFILNEYLAVYFKYSTRCRSPWSFTFTQNEQLSLHQFSSKYEIVIAFICGSDSVAAISYNEYITVATLRTSSVHLACFRKHRKQFEISGPDGVLCRKVAPSDWQRIFNSKGK